MSFQVAKLKSELKGAEEWLAKEYSQVHSGRATPSLLDSVLVESYGSRMPIKNVASVNIEDPKTLRVAPWDKSLIKEIERGIQSANLGLSTVIDNDGLRVIFPLLTTERRAQLVKVLKEKLEDARITVRKIREGALTDLKNDKLPEDTERRTKDDIQKSVDEANKSLEGIFAKKEQEIMN